MYALIFAALTASTDGTVGKLSHPVRIGMTVEQVEASLEEVPAIMFGTGPYSLRGSALYSRAKLTVSYDECGKVNGFTRQR